MLLNRHQRSVLWSVIVHQSDRVCPQEGCRAPLLSGQVFARSAVQFLTCFCLLLPSYGKYLLDYNRLVFAGCNPGLYKQLKIQPQPQHQRSCLLHRAASNHHCLIAEDGWKLRVVHAPSLHNAVPWFGHPEQPGPGLWVVDGNGNTTRAPA